MAKPAKKPAKSIQVKKVKQAQAKKGEGVGAKLVKIFFGGGSN